MTSKVIIKSVVVFGIINFFGLACCGPFDDPGEFSVNDYLVVSTEVSTDYTLPDRVLLEQDSVKATSLKLLLRPTVQYISQQKNNVGLINHSYACSPPEPDPTQTFENITITSSADFILYGDTLKSGESLNYLFRVNNDAYMSDFIRQDYPAVNYDVSLSLRDSPTNTVEHKLKINILLSDNRSFDIYTYPIKIYR